MKPQAPRNDDIKGGSDTSRESGPHRRQVNLTPFLEEPAPDLIRGRAAGSGEFASAFAVHCVARKSLDPDLRRDDEWWGCSQACKCLDGSGDEGFGPCRRFLQIRRRDGIDQVTLHHFQHPYRSWW